MPLKNILLVFVVLIVLSDIVAAAIGAMALWRIKHLIPICKYVAMLLTAMVANQVCQIVGDGLVRCPQSHGPWSLSILILGRAIRAAAVWALVLYILGIGRKEIPNEENAC